MLNYLKKQPLFGLVLAVAAGILLAHFALKGLNFVYETYVEPDPLASLAGIAAIAVPVVLIYRFRSPLGEFIGGHKWKLATAAILISAASLFVAHRMAEVAEGNRYANEVMAREAAQKRASHAQSPNPYDAIAAEEVRKAR